MLVIRDLLAVTSEEQKQLVKLASQLEVNPRNQVEYCALARTLAADLPLRISRRIDDFRDRPRKSFLIVSNLPLGAVPSTPVDNKAQVGQGTLLARVQAITNQRLGSMVAYETQGSGQLFHDLAPSLEESDLQTSVSYNVELDGHTEQCFSPLRPDFLSLACLRSDQNALTYVFSAAELLRHLPTNQRLALFQNMWETGVDTSFRMADETLSREDRRGPISLLQGNEDDPFITVDETLTRGLSLAAQELLESVLTLYHEHREKIVLTPGDLVILDNNRCMHGRSSFAARLDRTDRFILRTFVIRAGRDINFAIRADSRTVLARYS